jgi:hypothetical protein
MMLLLHPLLTAASIAESRTTVLSERQYDPGTNINCKEYSFSQPEWYLYDPSFTMYTGGTSGDVGFSAYNVATNLTFDCYAKGVDLSLPINATEWHNCSVPDTQFSFSALSNSFGLRQTWICDNAPEYVMNDHLRIEQWCKQHMPVVNVRLASPSWPTARSNCQKHSGATPKPHNDGACTATTP